MFVKPQINMGLNCTKMHFWQVDKLSCGQAQNEVKFDFQVRFDLEGQGPSPQNNRNLNQGLLHLYTKFGYSSLTGWWVIVRTNKWLIHTRTNRHTDAGNDNTRRPKLASGKNACENYTFQLLLQPRGQQINSLRPSDTIWQHRPGSTLIQVMACCLTASSHYLHQRWFIISKVY